MAPKSAHGKATFPWDSCFPSCQERSLFQGDSSFQTMKLWTCKCFFFFVGPFFFWRQLWGSPASAGPLPLTGETNGGSEERYGPASLLKWCPLRGTPPPTPPMFSRANGATARFGHLRLPFWGFGGRKPWKVGGSRWNCTHGK